MATPHLPIIPVGNKLLAEPIEKQEEKIGSLIIPSTVNMNLLYAKVVAISEEAGYTFKVGDTIIFPEGSGVAQMVAGKTYYWFQTPEIWGIYEDIN